MVGVYPKETRKMMAEQSAAFKTEFLQTLQTAWVELETCLDSLTESQMTDTFDDQGWNIKDHIAHLAAWEESMAMLFQRQARHQTLGIDLPKITWENMDEINAAIREQRKTLPVKSALAEFRELRIQHMLVTAVNGLSEEDLHQPVDIYFSQTPPGEDRLLFDMIHGNTTEHFRDHLPWIRKLAGS
jgi:hypothetical protein